MATNPSDPAARQYAQALLEIGLATNSIGVLYEELNTLDAAYRSDAGFRRFFTSPKVPTELKMKIVNAAISGMSETMRNFVGILIRKRRETLLDNITDAFAKYRDQAESRVHVFADVAKPLDKADQDAIVSSVGAATGKSVAFHENVNGAVLGGIRLRIGDRVVDATLRRRLRDLAHHLADANGSLLVEASGGDVDELFENARNA